MARMFDRRPRRGFVAVVAASATIAWGHDEQASPHVSCALDGDDTLICLYERHPTGTARQSRTGHADKGRYALSCPALAHDSPARLPFAAVWRTVRALAQVSTLRSTP